MVGGLVACKKDAPAVSGCEDGYQGATVVQGRNGCEPAGYLLQLDGGGTLPPDDLPGIFQQQGLKVCLTYTAYEDVRTCACCGGTRLRIQSIHLR